MKIPADAIIPRAKLTKYLLVTHPKDDKSKFLAAGGFTQENPDELDAAIRALIAANEAIEDFTDIYGTRYVVSGILRGTSGVDLGVISVWIIKTQEDVYRFVTLRPIGRPTP